MNPKYFVSPFHHFGDLNMEKFFVSGESVTKEQLTEALSAAKVEATVEQHGVDCAVYAVRPNDLPTVDGQPAPTIEDVMKLDDEIYQSIFSAITGCEEEDIPADDSDTVSDESATESEEETK